MTEQILLYLHLVVEVCARGSRQRFLGWDITVPFYDIRKEISVPFGLIAEIRSYRKSFFFSGHHLAIGAEIFQQLTSCLIFG
jgi:hypothetical protein